jgi:hypothetical protein
MNAYQGRAKNLPDVPVSIPVKGLLEDALDYMMLAKSRMDDEQGQAQIKNAQMAIAAAIRLMK